ncbi:MAG: PAB-dependent poly(A)-specific ribonuclease subunit 3 [Vezdaea aestivalis]|nr:MAG: PAB-dependent poly(A)-specific ribonuclease subunit 3 [Vezdaea aestivalis]
MPSSLASNGVQTSKAKAISPKAAIAAPFKPRGLAGADTPTSFGSAEPTHQIQQWANDHQEFVPQGFEQYGLADANTAAVGLGQYDSYGLGHSSSAVPAQINPYAQDDMGAAYQSTFSQPLNYHLYAPLGPHRENLLAYQRTVHDFFISDALREELQRKSEASRQILPNSTLPQQIDHFHSLVPLDTSHIKSATTFGYPSWVYKATSAKDGNLYALRRLEGYRLTNERAIRSVQAWKKVDNGSVVTIHDAFTTRAFGDSSLIFVTDYHPLSKTVADEYITPSLRHQNSRHHMQPVPEQLLWSYLVQIGSGLKSIHENGLAARLIDASKVLLTSKNRIRLNGCAVLDVVHHDSIPSIEASQQEDLELLGRLILVVALRNALNGQEMGKAMEYISRVYTPKLTEVVTWLITPPSGQKGFSGKKVGMLLEGLGPQIALALDETLHQNDAVLAEMNREVENARVTRLMMKLNYINERPEFEHDARWSETGERYQLKLFRDYVFHQVDEQGKPVVDVTHVLSCLGKLDVGVDERINLISRDEQTCIVVSYKELKRAVESAFQEVQKASRRN